ncbi:MAG: rhamnulose-1-phosphate aldolase [Planctomycetota bacterium]
MIDFPSSLHSIFQEIFQTGDFAWKKGWVEGAAGNLSIHLPHYSHLGSFSKIAPLPAPYPRLQNQYFLVSASGQRFREFGLDPATTLGIFKILDNGTHYGICWGFENTRPTSELSSHLAIHELRQFREPIGAVLHVHATHLILIASYENCRTAEQLSTVLCHQHTEVDLYLKKGVGYVGFEVPGSIQLAHKSLDSFSQYDLAIWEGHGAVSVGNSLKQAYDRMEVADKQAELFLKAEHSGLPRRKLSPYFRQEIRKALFGDPF